MGHAFAQIDMNPDKEYYQEDKDKHQINYGGGETYYHRITKNEVAIDYLKKEVKKLREEIEKLKAKK